MSAPRGWSRNIRCTLGDLCRPQRVPGYALCSRRERLLLDWRALRLFCRTGRARWLALFWVAWQGVGYCLVRYCDGGGAAAALPALTGALWLLPAVAGGRRRMLQRLLGPHWAGFTRDDPVL